MNVFVGLSGGVDSAVSAALLQERGYEVVGAFIKIWQPEFTECTWKEDRLDAMRVCVALGIPFREIDLSAEYQRDVVEEMLAGYRRGETPNPDVLCNRSIKFGAFAAWARAEGAEYVATGHYARIEARPGSFHLLRGVDAAKDQSYFLYRLGQEDLAHALFPVGELPKARVRMLAKRFGLPVAHKPDSQGLCFVGEVSMRDFLARYIDVVPGAVHDAAGTIIGEHEGAAVYTLGQRHGFVVHGEAGRKPHYVVRIDIATNTLTVSARREDAMRPGATLRDTSWVADPPADGARVVAQCRYHEPPAHCTIHSAVGAITVAFDEPRLASPGQALVLYRGDELIGGGAIAA